MRYGRAGQKNVAVSRISAVICGVSDVMKYTLASVFFCNVYLLAFRLLL